MKKYKVILLGIFLLLVLAGANIAYRNLNAQYLEKRDQNSVTEAEAEQTKADQTEGEQAGTEQETALRMAADFTVFDDDRNAVKLSDYKGKPVVVNFWASWCPPCKRELPAFQEMWKKYGDDVTFLMVSETDGTRETKQTAKTYIEQNGYEMNILFDLDGDAAFTYLLMYLPRTLFIDADGNLIDDHVGEMTESELEEGIQQLLSGKSGETEG